MATSYCEECDQNTQGDSTKFQDQFTGMIRKLREEMHLAQISILKLNEIIENAGKEADICEQKIKERCSEMRSLLDEAEEELLNEAEKFRNETTNDVRSKIRMIEHQKVQMESIIDHAEEHMKKSKRSNAGCNGVEIIEKAEQLIESYRKSFDEEQKVDHLIFTSYNQPAPVKNHIGKLATHVKVLVTIGLKTLDTTEQKICRVHLDNPDRITVINSTPAHIREESAACVINNTLYAVGIGRARKEMWAWSADRDEWTRCADMTSGRRRHCVTSVRDKIYVLAGWVDAEKRVLDSILRYDINSNTWTEPGKLCHAVWGAACVTYKHCIYVFGGCDKDNRSVKHVQVYNTVTSSLSLSPNPMPAAQRLMRAVLLRSKALLIGMYTCYIYSFNSFTWMERKRFKAGVSHFGLTLDDDTLYISGGGTYSTDENNRTIWTFRDDVISLSVEDFLSDNKEAEWKHHAKLPVPAAIQLYGPSPMFE